MYRIISLIFILCLMPTVVVAENLEFCEKANKAQITNDYKLAISYYIKCIEIGNLSPKNRFLALYDRGTAYLANSQFGNAISDFDQAIQMDPKHAYAWNNRGHAMARSHDYDRAIHSYTKAIQLAPNDDGPLYNRGNVYRWRKQFYTAIENYNGAIRLNKTNVAAYINRGISYRRTEQFDLAITDFNTVLRLDPNNSFTHPNRGLSFLGKQNYKRALEDFSEAIRRNPNDATAYFGRGRARFFSGLYDGAISDFKTLVSLGPNDPFGSIWLYLSQIRSGRDGRQDLAANAARFVGTKWPGPIYEMLLGQKSIQTVLKQAKGPVSVSQRERETEAYFYAGQQELALGSRTDAENYFRSAVELGITYFLEYTSAQAELKRLGY